MKIFLFLALTILGVSCVTRPPYVVPQRGTSSIDAEMCIQNFNKAIMRFRELIKTHSSDFHSDYIAKISLLPTQLKVICVAELKNTYGSRVDRGDNSVIIEEQMQSLAALLDSNFGAKKILEYKIDSRYINYDRLLVAVAAHSMAELTEVDDKDYDIFFRTLKTLENKMN